MGKIQIIDDFYSPLDKGVRTLRIYTPDSYESSPGRAYPVIYMTDGQNVFSHPRSARYDTWCVNPTLEAMFASGELQREWIVCAIDHSVDRLSEYSPWAYPAASIFDPLGRRFLNNLTEFFIPYVNANYRTLTGPSNTAFIGSSLGGLMALFCGYERPDVIGRIGAVSPSVMWSDFRCFGLWKERQEGIIKIYLDMGSEESVTVQGIRLDYVSPARDFYRHLIDIGYPEDMVTLYVDEGGIHHETSWARRFHVIAARLLNDA